MHSLSFLHGSAGARYLHRNVPQLFASQAFTKKLSRTYRKCHVYEETVFKINELEYTTYFYTSSCNRPKSVLTLFRPAFKSVTALQIIELKVCCVTTSTTIISYNAGQMEGAKYWCNENVVGTLDEYNEPIVWWCKFRRRNISLLCNNGKRL